MTSRASLCGVALAALLPPAFAQNPLDADLRQDEILIEGSRLNQTAAETGASVSVITAADIEAVAADFAIEAIASAPGVTVNQNGAFGGAASVRIRGAQSAQTLVLIDGVAVNDASAPGGGYNFATLDAATIERIEILKGPQSTLWGSDAIGGVVSIITRRPEDGVSASGFAEAGSFETRRGGAAFGAKNDAADVRLAVSAVSSDGISKADDRNGNSETDPYEATSVSLRAGVNLGEAARLEARMLYTDADAAFDSFVFGAEGNVGDGPESARSEELAASFVLTADSLGGRLSHLAMYGRSEIDRQNFFAGAPSFGAEGARDLFRYQGGLVISAGQKAAFGVEREDSAAGGDETRIDSLFALYEIKPSSALTLTAGVRRDDHETYGAETTARAALAWEASQGLTMRASLGQGFKAPTLFQTTFFCCGAAGPNVALQPETSDSLEVGADWTGLGGRLDLGGTLFRQESENLIDFAFAQGAYVNIAEATSQGIELYGAFRLAPWLTLAGDYAFIDAEDGAGARLARVPRHSGEVRAEIDPKGPLSGVVTLRHNGEEAENAITTLEAWTRLDVAARWRLSETVEVYGRIENLTDEAYQQVLGYGTPGRSGRVGVRVRL